MNFKRKIFSVIRSLLDDTNARVQTRLLWYKDITPLHTRHLKNCKVIADRTELLTHLPKRGVVAEIGVEFGNFSKEILIFANPRSLVLIDINLSEELKKNLNTRLFHKAKFFLNDSVKGLAKFPDKYFDWIYIDSSHDYQQTKKELAMCKKKIKKGGLICGHDYILFSYTEEIHYGVVKAVNEFCAKNDWEIQFLTLEPHGYYSFVLKEMS